MLFVAMGVLPGQEYFRVSRIELFDSDGNLIDTIKLPAGGFLQFEDSAEFSRMDLYCEWRFTLTDPDPDPPEQLRMVIEILGKYTSLPTGTYVPPPDSGEGPYGLSIWDHHLTWVQTGTNAGDPEIPDYECKSAAGGILFATITAEDVETKMNPEPEETFLLKVKRTLGPTIEDGGYVPASMEYWESTLGTAFVVPDFVGSVFQISSWDAWGSSDTGVSFSTG
jgi:hypothetical protein